MRSKDQWASSNYTVLHLLTLLFDILKIGFFKKKRYERVSNKDINIRQLCGLHTERKGSQFPQRKKHNSRTNKHNYLFF